ncbi:thiamine pyrophosphate-dependent enzyme [Nocardiopsis sp. CC223A]|uniref:thiamine pyrophosphate-dependent enzyme n=1 Tax=Nocardiopsis sp. CC223A TaxID=3044051 RepID=UPI00278BF68C|nr:thiamine pyrophosphate-dependent enzyme [Nocardiopsis sp. CC223A]
MDIRAAIRTLFDAEPFSLRVTTCGFITRDAHGIEDTDANLYLVGSMGMAAPVGLGVALAHPGRRVLVLDGDGSFAMNPGCLPMIAGHRPDLVHVVLDNGSHESTGGQRTSPTGDPAALALAAGYAAARSAGSAEEIRAALRDADPPTLLHIRCPPRTGHPAGRVRHTPQRLVSRFREGLERGRERTR